MSSFFGLCFGPISGEEAVPPGAGVYQLPWPWGTSGAGMPQTVQKREPGTSRLPQRGQMPGMNGAAAYQLPWSWGTSGAGMPQTVQKREPGTSRLPQRGQMPGMNGAAAPVQTPGAAPC